MPHLKFSTDDLTWNTATFNQYISKTSWTTVNSNFGTTIINSVSYGNGIWVVGGYGGLIRHSTNGNIWTTVTSNFGSTPINAIEYGNSEFIAVVNTGAIRASTDGISWSTRTGLGSNIPKIAYGNGLWVRTEAAGALSTSTDGINWTARTSNFGAATYGNAIAYGNGRWVAGTFNGQIRSSTDAVTWTTVISNFSTNSITSIAYGNNLWVAGGVNANVRLSTDSIIWTTAITNFASTNTIESVKYDNGLWIFAASNGWLHSSTDNLVWTTLNSNVGTTIKSINYGNGLWVFGGGNGEIRTSTDPNKTDGLVGNFVNAESINSFWGALTTTGQLWINQPSDSIGSFNISSSYPESIKQLTTFNNQFVALSNDNVTFSNNLSTWSTYNALNWTTIRFSDQAITNTNGFYYPIYENGRWMVINSTSTDLINWELSNQSLVGIRGMAYGNGRWVVGGVLGIIRTSTDTLNWITAITPNIGNYNINTIAYGNGLWIAGGRYAHFTSTDALNWSNINLMFGNTSANSIAYGNGMWVAVGNGAATGLNQGRISNSTDGITWTTNFNSNFFESTINSVSYANGLWVAVGESRSEIRIRTSTNGISWNTVTNAPFPVMTNLKFVAYGNGLWAAAGNDGSTSSTIIKSTNGTDWTTVNFTFGITNIGFIQYGNNEWLIGQNTSFPILYKSFNLEDSPNFNKIIKTKNEQEMLILANNGKIYNKKGKYETLWRGISTGINDNFINGVINIDYSSVDINNTGKFWTSSVPPTTVGTSVTVKNIIYSNGLWILSATGGLGPYYSSTNLTTWITQSNLAQLTSYLGFKGGVYFNLGINSGRRSTDGISWSTLNFNTATSSYPSTMDYGQGKWIMTTWGGTPQMRMSTDSQNWTTIVSPSSHASGAIAYGNGMWVMGGSDGFGQGGKVYTSTNGLSWSTNVSVGGTWTSAVIDYVEYTNNNFYIKTMNRDMMFRSTNAVDWSFVRLPNDETGYYNALNSYNQMYLMGNAAGAKSTDGISWISTSNPTQRGVVLGASGGGMIFGLDTWLRTPLLATTVINFTDQIYNYSSIVLQGNNASYYSTNMISWTTLQTAPAANTVNAIISKD